MSNPFQIPARTTNYIQQAEEAARTSQNCGKQAIELYQEYTPLERKRDEWDRIFSSTSPYLLTISFGVCSIVEFLLSMDLYREIIPYPYVWVFADAGMIFLAWKTGNYLRKKHKEHIDWDMYEERLRSPDLSEAERKSRVDADTKSDLKLGYIMLILTTLLVLGLSYDRRVRLMGESFGLIDVLPALFYVLTCLSAVHVGWVVKRLGLARIIRRKKKAFAANNEQCQVQTANALHYYQKGKEEGEDTSLLSHDVKETLYRHANNSSLDNGYALVEHAVLPQKQQAMISAGTHDEPQAQHNGYQVVN